MGVPYSWVDSVLAPESVLFQTLQARLIRFVTNRISNGEYSERGLAKLLRVSQPQLHKVLKGERKLTSELADRVLVCFGISVMNLLESCDLAALSERAGGGAEDRDGRSPEDGTGGRPHKQRQTAGIPRKGQRNASFAVQFDFTKTA